MKKTVQKVVGLAVLTAVVVVLQMFASAVRFGVFQISLVLIPIVVGAALYGCSGGAWLGLVFGAVVLLNGDAAAFLALSVPGTIITVLAKGTCAGLAAGLFYRLLKKTNDIVACIVAAISAPVFNTGIFVIGCRLFFFDTISTWAEAAGYMSVWKYILIAFIGGNFLVELAINIVFAPVIVKLIGLAKKEKIA